MEKLVALKEMKRWYGMRKPYLLFWDGKTKGTRHIIILAQNRELRVYIQMIIL